VILDGDASLGGDMPFRAILTTQTMLLSSGLLLVLMILILLVYVVASGFSFKRISLAIRCEWRVLRDPAFAEKVEALLTPKVENQLAGERAKEA
jgi:hypothetical protein